MTQSEETVHNSQLRKKMAGRVYVGMLLIHRTENMQDTQYRQAL